jgi:hypothetical protein
MVAKMQRWIRNPHMLLASDERFGCHSVRTGIGGADMRSLHVVLAATLCSTVSASGQSLNIDFGAEAGSPPSSYAGAGLPGIWNVIHQPWKFPPQEVFGPFNLVDLNGKPTSATFSGTNTLGTFLNDPGAPAGDDATLMQDGLIGISPDIAQNFTISGLENGLYRFITYTWYWPSELYGMVVFVKGSNVAQPVNGPWPGQHRLPVTHMMHVVNVTDGTIKFDVVGAGPGSFFNGNNFFQGLQLWKIPVIAVDCFADIAPKGGNGNVDVDDLLLVINSWGRCRGCVADIEFSGIVDVDDLLAVINQWGECPGGGVSICGDPRLGDCYIAHAGVGCSEPACCEAICNFDPFCCAQQWDQLCADFANIAEACAEGVHPNCGNDLAGDCFSAANPPVPGCNDSACCATVCAQDPFCCTFGWDSICVSMAQEDCAPAMR